MNAWIRLVIAVVVVLPAFGELPFIESGEWRGYYAVHEAQRYDFIYKHDGEMLLIPKKRDKEGVAVANRIKLEYGIEEMRPDGTTVFKQTRSGSLEAEHGATDKIDRIVVRGTTTGDAVYELVIEESRDVVSVGGRVVEVGSLTEHPLRFMVRVTLPNVYRRVEVHDRDDERDFDKRTRRDYLEVVRIDHSKVSLTNDDTAVMDGAQLTGSGVEEIEMRLSYYEGRRFFFAASRNSGIAIANARSPGPWYEGMLLHWTTDPSKDRDGSGRLNFWIK